jgi:riboflavin synthase
MFTGIVEELGTIVDLISEGTSLCLKIEAQRVFLRDNSVDGSSSTEGAKNLQNGLKIGDSIAVNGVCLTATRVSVDDRLFTPPYFEVTAVRETLEKTTLGSLITGNGVNLERAATIETRLGGHIVQGHVDGVATISEIRDLNGSWEFFFELPAQGERFVVPQGSIAIDGVSLTIAEVTENGEWRTENRDLGEKLATRHSPLATSIKIAIIPHTYYHTNFENLKAGDKVNVEFDVIAKMVERLVKPYLK